MVVTCVAPSTFRACTSPLWGDILMAETSRTTKRHRIKNMEPAIIFDNVFSSTARMAKPVTAIVTAKTYSVLSRFISMATRRSPVAPPIRSLA